MISVILQISGTISQIFGVWKCFLSATVCDRSLRGEVKMCISSIDGLEDCNPVSRDDVEYSKFYRGIFPITAILVVQNGPFPKNK